ncbi:MAG: amidohydrolase/deacetylase family metallohydrolase [Deltaproteobacteria bacterium]|nr:amidohydrolase/deacetylase family metallohydrolase [Deltaproteobacteria bacterium]MDZ4342883.1 amidohydrolase/deacetylase family metallohydrolase [Candidatus Binatia bacterium]
MPRQLSDFLLKGGRLIDPASGRDGLFDVRVRDGVVDAIGADLPPDGPAVIDVKDQIVTPGLIDVHLHLMKGLGAFGVDPDVFGVGSGVTTVVDAGSAGHSLLNVFRNYVTDNAKTRVLNYINLSTLGGVTGPGYSILADPRLIDEDKIEKAVEANRDIIVGIKIMATGGALGAQGLKPLERARKLGDSLKLPLLVHIGESWTKDTAPVHVGDVLKYLRAGDIVTHMFTVHPGGLLDGNGKLWPQVRDAKESGVLMDVGHGLHNLNFDIARRVLDQGLQPDGVSTDGHRGNRAGPVYDLPTTMAKLMALGFSLNQVIEMATVNAARLLGRMNELGTLRIGLPAEISVLRIEDREWNAVDSQKGMIPAKQALVPVYAIRQGAIFEPLIIERP